MKSIRYYIDLVENAGKLQEGYRHYDMFLTVENWHEPEDPDDENFPAEINLGIDYRIVGRYLPATLEDPPEYPELDEVEVYDADTGQPITDLPPYIQEQIENAIWKDAEQSKYRDYDPPDDYDDYYR